MTRLQQTLATCLTVVTVVQLSMKGVTSEDTFTCSPPCLNGGICIAENTCMCTGEFEGPICLTQRTQTTQSKPDCLK
ncbi:sushi, nidogen and EGF-like domain-containing protein 1 [Haliotis rufescens]|uniref:sushi, nidogen and EGF-like domain-containing protein 1 n=1 Tax=Haliotis rufescens TaxID=6454 RepID=UPI00201EFEF4|nr:sushi, nidogen and EGF-like domain-containing protein 1 [Haliotis rufescens]